MPHAFKLLKKSKYVDEAKVISRLSDLLPTHAKLFEDLVNDECQIKNTLNFKVDEEEPRVRQ